MSTRKFFGQNYTAVVLRTSDNFNGSAYTQSDTNPSKLSVGVFAFDAQAGGGLYNFHERPIEVKQIVFAGAGTLSAAYKRGSDESPMFTGISQGVHTTSYIVMPGDSIKFTSAGSSGASITIIARELQVPL